MGRSIVVTRPPAALVAGVLVAGLLVLGARGAPASDAQPEPTFHAANTITLAPKGPGSTVGGTLFNIGIVRVSGRCGLPKSDPGWIGVSMFVTNTGPRPVVFASGDQENSQVLAPGEGEVIAMHGAVPEWRGGTSGNVGIFDEGGVSATLLGAASGNPEKGRCTFTAQAAG